MIRLGYRGYGSVWYAGENNDGGGLCSLAYAVVSGVSREGVMYS